MQSALLRRIPFVSFALAAACGAPAAPVAPEMPVTVDVARGTGTDEARRPPPAEGISEDEGPVPVGREDPTWGSRNAPVTIVEFSDFQCPFCARAKTTIEQLKTDYGPTRLRIVWKHQPLPFHPNARPAAEAAHAVFLLGGPEAFWRFHDAVFENQRALSSASDLAADRLAEWARDAGVDGKSLRDPRVARAAEAKVDKDLALASTLGNAGTPGFFINGTTLSGAQPLDAFKAVIDAEMAKAQEKVASGTAPGRVYLTMTAENRAGAPARVDPDAISKVVHKLPVGSGPSIGPKNAPVTIVEFGDFQDPFTARVAATIKKLLASNVNDVRLVWRDLPLSYHQRAEPAAELAREARAQKGDAAFWIVADRLLSAQQGLEDSDLESLAAATGLDVDKVKTAIRMHKYKPQIDADASIADDFSANGTPYFFINGRKIGGAYPIDVMEKVVAEELARARAELAKGTPPAALYDALIKDGEAPPPPQKKTVAASANAPTKWGPNAKVTIVEFSDFQCPFCGKAEDALKQVGATYGDRVKLEWRHMPLSMHPQADIAAQASVEALQQKGAPAFWRMHDLLYANQATPRGLERDALDRYARTVGLDMVKWASAMDMQKHHALVEADAKAGRDAGISGTPAFLIVVNPRPGAPVEGYFLSGAQPFLKFKKLVDRALAEAK